MKLEASAVSIAIVRCGYSLSQVEAEYFKLLQTCTPSHANVTTGHAASEGFS